MAKRKKQKISGKTDRPAKTAGATKPQWKYARYPADDADWDRWYARRSEAVRGKFEDIFETLEDNTAWHLTGHYRALGEGLGEVKFHQELQWRFMGFFSGRQEFTITMICYHKEDDYEPREAKATALKRMKQIKEKKTQRVSCERPGRDDGQD